MTNGSMDMDKGDDDGLDYCSRRVVHDGQDTLLLLQWNRQTKDWWGSQIKDIIDGACRIDTHL